MAEKIMLIDGNSIINRAFYGVPLLTNAEGRYTNAVYGFFNILFKLLDEDQPDYLAVAFDMHAPTFRHKTFDGYKGTRKGMPEELREQMPLLKEVLTAMHIPIYEQEGYEADDILGSLSKKAEDAGLIPVVVSGDRDLLQIAGETLKVRIPKTKGGRTETEDYYAKDVMEKYGVTPLEFIDVKALMGDASDNIPGVPSIGEKTAVKIIQQYHDIENAIAHVERSNALVEDVVKSMEETVEYSGAAIDYLDQLAENSIAQSESIAQLTTGVDQISAVVQTNSATSEESAAASEELSSQAVVMKQMIQRFRQGPV